MLCDIEFVYFDDEGKQQTFVLEQGIDLDYWNIRQFRRLLFLFSKQQEYQLSQLVIRPYASFQLLPPQIGEKSIYP